MENRIGERMRRGEKGKDIEGQVREGREDRMKRREGRIERRE